MISVGLDVAQWLKQGKNLLIFLFSTFSGVNARQVPSVTSQDSRFQNKSVTLDRPYLSKKTRTSNHLQRQHIPLTYFKTLKCWSLNLLLAALEAYDSI